MELFNRGPATGYRFLLLLFLSGAIMVMDHREQQLTQVRGALSVAVAPIQQAVSMPSTAMNWVSNTATSYQTLVDENARFRRDQTILNANLQKLNGLQAENDRLRALLGAAPRAGEKVELAPLLAVDSAPYVHMFTLARGSRDQVYQGQPVVDASGILGQVIRVGLTTSQVLLLTDTRSAIPIEDTRNGVRSIAVGRGPNQPLALVDVPKTEGVKVGDVLVSSGLGQRFPAGYPVGTVLSVVHNPGEHFATIFVEPSAEFSKSRLVLLVWPRDPKVNENELQKEQQPAMPDPEASPEA